MNLLTIRLMHHYSKKKYNETTEKAVADTTCPCKMLEYIRKYDKDAVFITHSLAPEYSDYIYEQISKFSTDSEYLEKFKQCVEKSLKEKNPNKVNDVAFFLKPYPDAKLQERLSWIKPYASYIGIDIDSYNILTMRNLVNLEKKTVNQLTEFRNQFEVPFVIKGVFTDEDLELVKELKPDVVYISNHGGRVETRVGSSAEFLQKHAAELKNYCDEIWVDGGIRTKEDVQTAIFYGADKVILARPFIRALFEDDIAGMEKFAKELFI